LNKKLQFIIKTKWISIYINSNISRSTRIKHKVKSNNTCISSKWNHACIICISNVWPIWVKVQNHIDWLLHLPDHAQTSPVHCTMVSHIIKRQECIYNNACPKHGQPFNTWSLVVSLLRFILFFASVLVVFYSWPGQAQACAS
jgi:hypothetical protein